MMLRRSFVLAVCSLTAACGGRSADPLDAGPRSDAGNMDVGMPGADGGPDARGALDGGGPLLSDAAPDVPGPRCGNYLGVPRTDGGGVPDCIPLSCTDSFETVGFLGEPTDDGWSPRPPSCQYGWVCPTIPSPTFWECADGTAIDLYRFCNPYDEPMVLDIQLDGRDARQGLSLVDPDLFIFEGLRQPDQITGPDGEIDCLVADPHSSPLGLGARVEEVVVPPGGAITVLATPECTCYYPDRLGSYRLRVTPRTADEEELCLDLLDPDGDGDVDGDGWVGTACGGDDCNDDPASGADINPGATEDCENGIDDNCDGDIDHADAACGGPGASCATPVEIDGSGVYRTVTRPEGSFGVECLDELGAAFADTVFRFTLTEPRDVSIAASVYTASGPLPGGLALRRYEDCTSGPDVACASRDRFTFDRTGLSFERRSVPAGEWAIVVLSSAPASVELGIVFSEASPSHPGDRCDGAAPLITASGTYYIEGGLEDDYMLSCPYFLGVDGAIRLRLDTPSRVSVTTFAEFFARGIAITTDCDDPAATIACQPTNHIEYDRLPAGDYFVIADAVPNGFPATRRVDVVIEPATTGIPGNGCANPIDITAAPGSMPVDSLVWDSWVSSCRDGDTQRWYDAVFSFTLAAAADVRVSTTGPYHIRAVSTECGVGGTTLACGAVSSTPLYLRDLPAGTYYVYGSVPEAQMGGTIGASVEILPRTPLPTNDNDTCEDAIDVSDGYVSIDTLQGFSNDDASCGYGVESFYKFTLTRRRRVALLASRRPASGELLYMQLRSGTCGALAPPAIGSCNARPTVSLDTVLEAGSYVFTIDAFMAEPDYNLWVVVGDE